MTGDSGHPGDDKESWYDYCKQNARDNIDSKIKKLIFENIELKKNLEESQKTIIKLSQKLLFKSRKNNFIE